MSGYHRNFLSVSVCVLAAGLLAAATSEASMHITEQGKARCVIVRQPEATVTERYAVEELARWLGQVTGATFDIRDAAEAPDAAIVVGPGPAAAASFPEVDLRKLDGEQIVIRVKGDRLLLAGGRPRGTLYAVYRFLQDTCGVRWWTPWATTVPKQDTLAIGELAVEAKPAFESRDPFWFPAFNGDWAARNFSNSQSASLEEKHGGKILYKGFVHTFYPLIPPEKHFADHPEWFSMLNGKRTVEGGQLCTTNPAMRRQLVERVREWLRESPDARIVSISQNDWYGACQCPDCKAVDDREGSHAGTMLDLVNHVARELGSEFPSVAFDTLAYQYTRKAPNTIRPEPNVIVRLCSIECDFRAPLESKSNQAFGDDLRAWGKVSNRLYIWDYTTNFAHYTLPHPNWFSLGANVRFFRDNGVKGLFEQGAYQSHGSEMSELRAWVLARLLWDPDQDDGKLIDEFLSGYYGAAAPPIRKYMDLLHQKSDGFYLTCYNSPWAPFLDLETLIRAERLWGEAQRAVAGDPDRMWRVRQGRLPVRYAFLQRWAQLRRDAIEADIEWPLPLSRKTVADEWLAVATGSGPEGWAPMSRVNEGGLTPQAFIARFAVDSPDRGKYPPPPDDIEGADAKTGIEGQENLARLFGEGARIETRPDTAASDGLAVRMPGDHREWAFQIPFPELGQRARTGRWDAYVVARIETAPEADPDSVAFTAGVYDTVKKSDAGSVGPRVSEVKTDGYKSYRLGTIDASDGLYLWAAPAANPGVKSVWIDRVYLTPAKG